MSVGASGNSVVVGDGEDNAYVFDATNGQQTRVLAASDGFFGDSFGRGVAISGNTAIVSAQGDNDNGSNSGSAYLFDTTTGQQLFKLKPSDGTTSGNFGRSVAISGTTALVGTDFSTNAAYLFDTTTGLQTRRLAANDSISTSRFGYSVALSGNFALVGALRGTTGNGAAYLFNATTGEQLFKFIQTDGGTTDRFGESVALTDRYAIVGASQNDPTGGASDQQGATYVFDLLTGQQVTKFTAADAAADDHFGQAVAASGNTILVGSPRQDPNGIQGQGAAYTFSINAVTVPEASTSALALAALGMIGVVVIKRRK